jgi:uncharacterized protein
LIYLDTSALIKLVFLEEHSAAFEAFMDQHEDEPSISSVLTIVETRRAVLREDPSALARADLVLSRVGKVGLGPAVVEAAGRLPDRGLRALDAVHLASALLLDAEVSAFVTYDERLLVSAATAGLPTVRPT